jgi:hypothetical protein
MRRNAYHPNRFVDALAYVRKIERCETRCRAQGGKDS